MELKEGMYVRTFCGKIYQITELDLQFEMTKQTCKKASNNIIDLIEVGDYVNGYKVAYTMKSLLGFEEGQDGDWYMGNENIKSIVTKEQFESMSYKVGE